jgi:hypothetical protein
MSEKPAGGSLMAAAANKGRIMDMKSAAAFVEAASEPMPQPTPPGPLNSQEATNVSEPEVSSPTSDGSDIESGAPGIRRMIQKEEPPEYPTVPLNSRIPLWLDQEIDKVLKDYDLVKQQLIINALQDYLGVRPPHERKGKSKRG